MQLTPAARHQAIRDLIRPWEVQHLWHTVSWSPFVPVESTASKVANWLSRCLSQGHLAYIADPPDADIWCPPSATLRRQGGDCEDLAILAASMVEAASGLVPYVVVGLWCTGGTCGGHAWVEGYDELGWSLIEATAGVLYRGARPAEYKSSQFLHRGGYQFAA